MSAFHKKSKTGKIFPKRTSTGRIIHPGDEYLSRGKAMVKSEVVQQGSNKLNTSVRYLKEPLATYTSRIRAIGNSKGVILNNNLIESAGLNPDLDIVIQAGDGVIII